MAAGWKDGLMADTGAPWNIPYVEPSDLVRDYPAADEAQALAIAAGLDIGLGTNVAATLKPDIFSTTSNSFVAVTGLNVNITPSSTTSKVLVIVNIALANSGNNSVVARLTRGTTAIGSGTGGTSNGFGFSNTNLMEKATITFLDSPGVDTQINYKVDIATDGGTAYVNRRGADTFQGASSDITVIEVAA
jgi:hypothetical protein